MSFRHAKSPAFVCWTCGEALKSGLPETVGGPVEGLIKPLNRKNISVGVGMLVPTPLL